MAKCALGYKVTFPTKEAAKRKMQEIKKRNVLNKLRHNHSRTELRRAYECKVCGGWHLTSKE